MSTLRVSFIQANLHWEDVDANLAMFTEKISQIETTPDLIILPEMFATGFSMAPEILSEKTDGKSVEWMQKTAQQNNCVITGSLIIEERKQYFNRLFWVLPNGTFETYNKRHLFSLAGEEKHYTAGTERLTVDLKGFKIMPLICYDLRFPVWSRNDVDYDIALYVANWPERRSFFWSQLLIARAIENQAYIIGVNRVGNDGNNISHSGDSVCLDPLGGVLAKADAGKEAVISVTLSKDSITRVRDKFRFLNDKDSFNVIT